MKKNRIIFIAVILLLSIVISATVILIKKSDSTNTEGTKTDRVTETDKDSKTDRDSVAKGETDVKIITFAVPNVSRIDDDHLQQFNDALIKDGYNYVLEIKYLEDEAYAELLKDELNSGDTDIAFLGLGEEGGPNNIYDLIHSGLVFNLDEILSQERGKVLYDAFPKNLWESVKCDKHIYSIPTALAADNQGVYAAFNRDYITDEDIEKWDGSIDGIYEMIKNVKWNKSDAPCFQYLISDYSFGAMIGCEISYGLVFDYDSLSIENPLESEKFIGYLNVLDQMKEEGYMAESISYRYNIALSDEGVLKNIEDGNYLVALSVGPVDEVFLKDNITVKKVPPYLSSRINSSIGISKNTDDIDAVVDFLGLLYGDGKYGNILLYGQEGTDYKVIDGVACNMDGAKLDRKFLAKLFLNLYVNIYPVSGETYMSNRKNEFFSFYDSVNLSPFIGFEPDTAELNNISNDLDEFMNSLSGNPVDEAVSRASDQLKADGIENYLNSVKSQWEEYRQ